MNDNELAELRAWKVKYREAAEMWDSLELRDNDQVTDAVMIAKVSDFESGSVTTITGTTDGTDWVTQLGLFEAWKGMNIETRIERRDD
jgi:hypothetical protein